MIIATDLIGQKGFSQRSSPLQTIKIHPDLTQFFDAQLFLVRNKIINNFNYSNFSNIFTNPNFFINNRGNRANSNYLNGMLRDLACKSLGSNYPKRLTCQGLRRVSQTHFFRSNPSFNEVAMYNKLADHTFVTACYYYRLYKEAETLYNQMDNPPEFIRSRRTRANSEIQQELSK